MSEVLIVPTMAEMLAQGKQPEVLFWVGCAGSFDDRAKKITKAIVKILKHCNISFAVLGKEESCTGDPAKRAGNDFLFQMQALQNINTLNNYKIQDIVTACPHCFNTLKNEYPQLGGNYEVVHHSQYIQKLIDLGKLTLENKEVFKGKKITFHDPCYLGRGNGLCCGAGGAQMFKEAEKGNKEINIERAEEALALNPQIIATGCPFCNTMMTDGLKHFGKEKEVHVIDLAELIAEAQDL